jgi:hypothetical protein
MPIAPIAVLLAMAAASAAPLSTRPSLQLVIRDATTPPLGPRTLRDILNEVRVIWHSHVDIDSAATAGAAARVTDDVLTVAIVDQPPRDAAAESLGWIDFVDGQPSRTITISRHAAAQLRDRAVLAGRALNAWPPAVQERFMVRALGRAVAHEVGHYLLASKAHEPTGLMRARFGTTDLMDRSPKTFALSPADLLRLEQRFSSYRLARRGLPEPSVQ